MSEFKVPVVRVRAIEAIPNADRIELAVVGEYRCVTEKGRFLPGDLAVYLPEAALLPPNLLDFLGMTGKLAGPDHNRIKAIKLRGCLSQGILLQIREMMELTGIDFGDLEPDDAVAEGANLASQLNITKYEPPIPVHMAGEVVNMFGRTLRYDIENFKTYPDILQDGEDVEFTEKLHGTFMAITRYPDLNHPEMLGGDTLVYSKGLGAKGLVFKDNEANKDNLYMKIAKDYAIRERIINSAQAPHESVQPVTLLGEIYGAGVQDLQYGVKKPHFMVFDIYIGKPGHGYFANRWHLAVVAHRMGLPTVPILYRGPFSREKLDLHTNGHTVAGNRAHIREGIVITPVSERYDPTIGRVILKSVSADYLLRSGNSITEYV